MDEYTPPDLPSIQEWNRFPERPDELIMGPKNSGKTKLIIDPNNMSIFRNSFRITSKIIHEFKQNWWDQEIYILSKQNYITELRYMDSPNLRNIDKSHLP